jgi:outer membrane lipopolysaccharide assembly protein LptE/RlpB
VKKIEMVVVVASVLLTIGCGYALVGRGSNIPEDVQMVYLAPLENNTPRAQVEQIVNQSIADEVVLRGRFDLSGGEEGADAVLGGRITNFSVVPVSFDDEGLAEEYLIQISAAMEFRRVGTDEILWQVAEYVVRENYELDEDETSFFDRENVAITGAAEIFARTLLTDLMEGF